MAFQERPEKHVNEGKTILRRENNKYTRVLLSWRNSKEADLLEPHSKERVEMRMTRSGTILLAP